MAENFYTILTKIGKAKMANAYALGNKLNLVHFAVGDGNGVYYNPIEEQTQLKREVWRGNISSLDVDPVNPNWIVCEAVIPSADGGFMMREAALIDDQGDIIAIGKYPETYKPIISEGSAKDLYIKMIIEISNSASVSLKIDPSVILATKKDIENVNKEITNNKNSINELTTTMADIMTYITPQMFYEQSDGDNWSLAIQRAIDYSKSLLQENGLGHHQIICFPSGLYTLYNQVIVPNFIKLKSIGNVNFISKVSGESTFRLYGNPEDNVSGVLTADNTFHSFYKGSWLNGLDGGFTLKLSSDINKTSTIGIEIGSRIDISGAEYFTGWWSINDITIIGFETGIYFNQYDMFLGNIDRLIITRCVKAVSFNGNGTAIASNAGEGIRFNNCTFGNNEDCITVNMPDLEVVFNGCSFDFSERCVVVNTTSFIRLTCCHFEGIGFTDGGTEIGGDTASIVYSTGGYWGAPMIVLQGSDVMSARTVLFRATSPNGLSLSIDSFTSKGSKGFNKLYAICDDNVDVLNNNFIPTKYLTMITQRKLNQKLDPNFESQTLGTTIINSQTITGYTFANNIQTASAVISDELHYSTIGKSLKLSVPSGGIWTTIKSEDFTCKSGDKIMNNLFWYIKDTSSTHTGRITAKTTFYDKNNVAITYPTTALDIGTIASNSTENEWNRLFQMEQVIAPANAVKFNVTYTINPTVQCTMYLGEFYTVVY